MSGAKQAIAWECASCGRVFIGKEVAEKCCVCHVCGGHAGDGRVTCGDCQEEQWLEDKEKRYAKAKRIPWREYEGPMVYVEDIDDWAHGSYPEEIQDAWECYNDESNPFPGCSKVMVYAAMPQPIALDPDSIADDLLEQGYEGYEISKRMLDDLRVLCAQWNAKHADTVYWPDYDLALDYGEEDDR